MQNFIRSLVFGLNIVLLNFFVILKFNLFIQVSHQTSNVWSLLENNWKMEGGCLITTSRKNPLFNWCWDFVVECKYLCKHWLVKLSRWKLKLLKPLKVSKLRSKTKKVSVPCKVIYCLLNTKISSTKLAKWFNEQRNLSDIASYTTDTVLICCPGQ